MAKNSLPEPWLRGTLTELPAVPRAVLHALELAREDIDKWCGNLSLDQLNARPGGIAPVAFHIRHIAGSMDRLLTYAEGKTLGEEQLAVLKTELERTGPTRDDLFAEFSAALERSANRIRALASNDLNAQRTVGNSKLPTSLGGLLVHVADHTQRHVGQAIITTKIVTANGQ